MQKPETDLWHSTKVKKLGSKYSPRYFTDYFVLCYFKIHIWDNKCTQVHIHNFFISWRNYLSSNRSKKSSLSAFICSISRKCLSELRVDLPEFILLTLITIYDYSMLLVPIGIFFFLTRKIKQSNFTKMGKMLNYYLEKFSPVEELGVAGINICFLVFVASDNVSLQSWITD